MNKLLTTARETVNHWLSVLRWRNEMRRLEKSILWDSSSLSISREYRKFRLMLRHEVIEEAQLRLKCAR